MAIRNTTHILKNSDIINRPLPSVLLKGEPIINTADGIMYFSGVTTSTSGWTQSGPTTPSFFEVGSNLYDLKIRNQITAYSGITNLSGKFLSGTTSGFVLADITNISGVDTYVTGFTYSNNLLTIKQNNGLSDLTASINTMTGLTVNGDLTVTGTTSLSGSTYLYAPVTMTNPYSVVNVTTLTSYTQTNDVYVTGNTLTAANNDTSTQNAQLTYHGTPLDGPHFITTENTFTTGGTYNNSTKQITFNKNNGAGGNYTVDLSAIDVNDTYVTGGTITTSPSNNSISGVTTLAYSDGSYPSTYTLPFTDVFTTGFTYNTTNNTFTLKDNSGNTFNQSFNTVSGLTLSNLTAGRVVYVGSGGLLTDESGFTYDDGTNTFSVPSDGAVNVGTGGLNVTGDAVIQGSLTVFGPSISAFTSQLYVEDSNISLNYNPTGNTTVTSLGAGWVIQDGNGVNGGNVNLNINRLDTLTGLTASNTPSVTEYTASTGYANRGFVTQLNDIVIRSTDISTPNGVRVLAEFDILDGGQY